MGRSYSTHGRYVHTKFWSENLKGRDLSEDLGRSNVVPVLN